MSDSTISILLLEDDVSQATLLEEFLLLARPEGVVLRPVTTLAAGLAILRQGGIDAVVADLSLPDSTGLDTLLRVRECAPDVPTAVMTGYVSDALAAAARAAGAAEVIVKGQTRHDEVVRRVLALAEGTAGGPGG